MTTKTKSKINPLSRIPRQQRLVMAVRGGGGVGKSFLGRSMAEGGLGRLCLLHVGRKAPVLPGVGHHLDGLEIEHPDRVAEFSAWALSGAGRERK